MLVAGEVEGHGAILPQRRGRVSRPSVGASVGLDGQHRAVGVEQHLLGVAAEDQLADRRPAAQPDDDEVGVVGPAMLMRSSAGSKPRTSWRTS